MIRPRYSTTTRLAMPASGRRGLRLPLPLRRPRRGHRRPVSFAAIALAWYVPASARLLAWPPATAHGVTVAWYAVASAALALTCAAMLDQWHRYARNLYRSGAG